VVTIAGDAARIEAVGYVETEALDLGGAAASISRAVRLVTPRGVTALGAQQVAVDVEIVKE
jgi:YbbR domain-containing protein